MRMVSITRSREKAMSQAKAEFRIVRDVVIPLGKAQLEGELNIPRGASGIVVFAHGSGSSRADCCLAY